MTMLTYCQMQWMVTGNGAQTCRMAAREKLRTLCAGHYATSLTLSRRSKADG